MLTWYVADMVTGDFVERFPFTTSGLERTIGARSTVTVGLDVSDKSVPRGWDQILDPMRALVVPVDNGVPLCGYFIESGGQIGTETTTFTLVSLEAIPERLYVLDGAFYGPTTEADFYEGTDDEGDVAAFLLGEMITGFGFELNLTQTGQTGDHSYSRFEDRTVASALADLSSQDGGPEWVTRIRWADQTHRRFIKTIEIGSRVGKDMQQTIFKNRHLTSRSRERSWARGAVRVIATGDGVGDSRPMSQPVVDEAALAAGVPPWQLRVPAPSISEESGLDRVAQAAAVRYRHGTESWELTIAQTERGAPRIVTDYDVGDRVVMDLGPIEEDPRAWRGEGRVIGWRARVEEGEIVEATPAFWNPDEED